MFLFAISFILIFTTSYLISSLLANNDAVKGCIYTLLIAFCQIILASEILSLLYKFKEIPFLSLNILFLIITILIWNKKGRPFFTINLKFFLKRIFNSCKLDKSLFILLFGWLFFICVSIILIILLPSTSGDAFTYHVLRSYDWVINQSLAHYETADIRCNCFPVNSEILYAWVILFTKKQLCLGAFTFVGYLIFLISSYKIFKYIGYSMRRTLWTFLIISSFASVVVMVSGTETDLVIAGLITTSIYLFVDAVKNKSCNITLFMSALAYALAIGVKAPAIICMPAVGLLYIIISFCYKDKFSLLKFIGFGIVNFLLFSSYNFILNFLDYGNIMGSAGVVIAHKNLWGIKGFFANFIKHIFLLIDFSGIKLALKIQELLINFEKYLIIFLHLDSVPEGLYAGNSYFNATLLEPGMGCGILSILLILPCWIISIIKPIFKKSRIDKIQFIFGILFFINLVTLSYVISFMTYNTRFITSFILISAPMLALSYVKSNKNIYKIMCIFFAMLYFTIISTHLWGRPFFRLINHLKTEGIVQFRSDIFCARFDKRDKAIEEWCNINGLLDSKFNDKKYKVLFMPKFSEYIIYSKIKKLQGFPYDFINAEHTKGVDFNKYDIIVFPIIGQFLTSFDNYSPDKIDYYLKIKENEQPEYYTIDKNAEISCFYQGLSLPISKQIGNENDIPVKKVCSLTKNFYKNHPFEIKFRTNQYFILLNNKTFPNYKN